MSPPRPGPHSPPPPPPPLLHQEKISWQVINVLVFFSYNTLMSRRKKIERSQILFSVASTSSNYHVVSFDSVNGGGGGGAGGDGFLLYHPTCTLTPPILKFPINNQMRGREKNNPRMTFLTRPVLRGRALGRSTSVLDFF